MVQIIIIDKVIVTKFFWYKEYGIQLIDQHNCQKVFPWPNISSIDFFNLYLFNKGDIVQNFDIICHKFVDIEVKIQGVVDNFVLKKAIIQEVVDNF